MVGDAYLPGHHHSVFDDRAAGNAGLGRDHYVFANLHVVADVHQVVELGAARDYRNVERAAVDGGVGADFHVVPDLQPPHLREFHVAPRLAIPDVTKSVAAQHRTRMNEDAVADARAGINADVGADVAVVTDSDTFSDENSSANGSMLADRRARFDDHVGTDVCRRRRSCGGIDDRSRMNQWVPHPDWCWKGGLGRMKQRRGSCKSQSRLRRNQQRLGGFIGGKVSHNHGACSRFHGRCDVLCVLNKHHVRSRCRLQAGDAFHLGVPAGEIRANLLSQFGELHNL